MHLVIFDIDGTLIHSHKKEARCFIDAVSKITGISDISGDLTGYQHVTDTGIANECIHRHFNRNASLQEMRGIENLFLEYFQNTLVEFPFTAIPGVQKLFEELNKLPDTYFAIATGAYYQSALLKLHFVSPFLNTLPLATANDHPERIHIMTAAASRAKNIYQKTEFSTITYIGDGPWDFSAVNTLGWNFIGVASTYSKETLHQWGAKWVISHYLSPHILIDYLIQSRASYGS